MSIISFYLGKINSNIFLSVFTYTEKGIENMHKMYANILDFPSIRSFISNQLCAYVFDKVIDLESPKNFQFQTNFDQVLSKTTKVFNIPMLNFLKVYKFPWLCLFL